MKQNQYRTVIEQLQYFVHLSSLHFTAITLLLANEEIPVENVLQSL